MVFDVIVLLGGFGSWDAGGSCEGGRCGNTCKTGVDASVASCERHFAKPFRRIHSVLMAIWWDFREFFSCNSVSDGSFWLMAVCKLKFWCAGGNHLLESDDCVSNTCFDKIVSFLLFVIGEHFDRSPRTVFYVQRRSFCLFPSGLETLKSRQSKQTRD